MRRTKIVATVGPASQSAEQLAKLCEAGVDIFRLNFSHGTQEEHGETLQRIRALEKHRQHPVPVLQDLAGPKIRIGAFEQEMITLETGARFTLTARRIQGNSREVSVSYAELPREVSPGDPILLSDGTLELKVQETTDTEVICEVLVGGELSSHKGVNLPSGSLQLPVLTEKDRSDLAFGLHCGVDFVAVSFVRNGRDIRDVHNAMGEYKGKVPIIAKIEKHEALSNIDEILHAADGLMIARGDLGVETPVECIPRSQKRLTRCGNGAAKPVITATHMLRSMVSSPRPTRAEVTDIANAVLDGSDAMMLSEETAIGDYPVESVEMMVRTIQQIEEIFPFREWGDRFAGDENLSDQEAVAHAACRLAVETEAAVIVTCTMSGSTTLRVAKYRPAIPVLALTPDKNVWRRLHLTWGVITRCTNRFDTMEEVEAEAVHQGLASGLGRPGQKIIITAGLPVQQTGATNLVKVVTLTHPSPASSSENRSAESRFRQA